MQGYLDIRRTHKYRAGWSHLDEYDQIGMWRVIRKYNEAVTYDEHGNEEEPDGFEPGPQVYLVSVSLRPDVPCDADDVKRSLMDTFTHSSCTHEHDCCGCVSSWVESVTQHPHDEDLFWVSIQYSRNV